MLEFAFVAPVMVLMVAGGFEVGFSAVRAIQASTVTRNATVLQVGGVDLSTSRNQTLLLSGTVGLGMTQSGGSADPNGKGILILTKIYRVGPIECAIGIPGWNGQPATCPNYGSYVIANRINIGNSTRWTSHLGTPGDTPASNGSLTDAQIATNTANASSAFPATVSMGLDQYAYLTEMYVDISAYNFFSIVQTPVIYMRNVS